MDVNLKRVEYVDLSLTTFRIVDGCIPCVSYTVLLEDDGVSWTVERRFRELAKFYNAILAAYQKCELPPFPPKTLMPSVEKSFINKRKQEMQKCLQALLQVPEIEKDQAVRDFFEFERADLVHRRDERKNAFNKAKEFSMQDRENVVSELHGSVVQRETDLGARETDLGAIEAKIHKREQKLRSDEQALTLRKAQLLRDVEKKQDEALVDVKKTNIAWRDEVENEFAGQVKYLISLIIPESDSNSIEALGKAIKELVAENEGLRAQTASLEKRLIAAEEGSTHAQLSCNKDSPQSHSPPTARDPDDTTTHDPSTARTNLTVTSDFGRHDTVTGRHDTVTTVTGRHDTVTVQRRVQHRVTHPSAPMRSQPLAHFNPSSSPFVPQIRQVPHLSLGGAASPVATPPLCSMVSTPLLGEKRILGGNLTIPQLNITNLQTPSLLKNPQ
eukprot:GEMP01009544.1.p1 GENE.GEMP01009544.1~~GEMP01009544.1.p1  ORF type:complete len:443 (+),score=120.04 GEMP01009544.1:88-1416(+)